MTTPYADVSSILPKTVIPKLLEQSEEDFNMSSHRISRPRSLHKSEVDTMAHITPGYLDVEGSRLTGTPQGTLRQLAMIPRPLTPLRGASNAGPSSIHKTSRPTPTAQARTPGVVQKYGGSGKPSHVLTPHGRAAAREIEARRAGLTPGKDRRRSGRHQRETPRDALRLLSRALAPKTQPVIPTPLAETSALARVNLVTDVDFDDDILDRPRLSIALDEIDDDSITEPPDSAVLEDDNLTAQSVEIARRATSDRYVGRLSRGSLGSIGISDQFGNFGNVESNVADVDSSRFGDIAFRENEDSGMPAGDNISREVSETLRNTNLAALHSSSLGPGSGHSHLPTNDSEASLFFTAPQGLPHNEEGESGVDGAIGEYDESQEQLPKLSADQSHNPGFDKQGSLEARRGIGASQQELPEDMPRSRLRNNKKSERRNLRVSKYGISYRPLPSLVVKRLATTFARTNVNAKAKLGTEALDAVMQASDWFFEQIGDDLNTYARHCGRRTIEESDVAALMQRQRQINLTTTTFSLAQRYLPRELLHELRMVLPTRMRQ